MNLGDLMNQLADDIDTPALARPDDIRDRGDRRRRRTATRWAAAAAALAVVGVAFLAGGDLDRSGSTPPTHPSPTTTAPTWNAQPVKPPIAYGQEPDLGAHDYVLNGLAADDHIYVMAGNAGGRGHVWLSPDGRSWAEPFEANAPAAHLLADVVDTGSGFLTAGQDSARHPAIWHSADGFVWTPSTLYSLDGLNGVVDGIAASPAGWVAWGTVQGRGTDGYIWRSDDGVEWVPSGDQSAFGGPGWQDIWAVQATDFGWIAFGRDESTGFKDSYAKWTANTSGEAWNGPEAAPDAVSMLQAAKHIAGTGPEGSLRLIPVADGFLHLVMPD
jgi:hypothetical protein